MQRALTLAEEDVHGAGDGDDSQEEVQRQVVAQQQSRHEGGENRSYCAAELLQDGVAIPALADAGSDPVHGI